MDTTKVVEAIGEMRTAMGETEAMNPLQVDEAQCFEHFTNKAIAWGLVAVAGALVAFHGEGESSPPWTLDASVRTRRRGHHARKANRLKSSDQVSTYRRSSLRRGCDPRAPRCSPGQGRG